MLIHFKMEVLSELLVSSYFSLGFTTCIGLFATNESNAYVDIWQVSDKNKLFKKHCSYLSFALRCDMPVILKLAGGLQHFFRVSNVWKLHFRQLRPLKDWESLNCDTFSHISHIVTSECPTTHIILLNNKALLHLLLTLVLKIK